MTECKCKPCGDNHFKPNMISKLVAKINTLPSDQKINTIGFLQYVADTHQIKFQDQQAISRFFSNDAETRAVVSAVDVQAIITIAKEACQIIGFLSKSV